MKGERKEHEHYLEEETLWLRELEVTSSNNSVVIL